MILILTVIVLPAKLIALFAERCPCFVVLKAHVDYVFSSAVDCRQVYAVASQ